MKGMVRSWLRRFGYDLRRLDSDSSAVALLVKAMRRFDIDLVLDVGANAGQFALGLRAAGYSGRIVSFEPLSTAYDMLVKAAERDAAWHVHERVAIGSYDGVASLNVAANSVSSSLLPMLPLHEAAATSSQYVGLEEVPVRRLDSVVGRYLHGSERCMLKIDTQGFEWSVMDGAPETLLRSRGVLCELSLVPLYDGQHLWGDVISRLEGLGFELWSLNKGFVDKRDGRTLQCDAAFFRL